MKELSIEQKARAYDKAFRIAQELYNDPNSSNVGKGYVCTVFPELKKSENADEKVRKALIKLVTNHASMDLFIEYDIHLDEALDWLEKQGEQKPADKVEPKFHEGEWIENEIEIPFGAKDSELQEASYHIPKGFYSVLDGNKVIIKRFKNPRPQNN